MTERIILIVAAIAALGMLLYTATAPKPGAVNVDDYANIPDDRWFQSEVVDADGPVLVEFGAVWCAPCRELNKQLEKLEAEYGDHLKVVKVDVDKRENLAAHFQITSVPTVLLFKNGPVVDGQRGLGPYEELRALVKPHL